jgi:transitional endoplasmic reticulum ATPase
MLTLLDGLRSQHGRVLAVGATNRPDALDEAVRRPGRLEWEVPLALPSEAERTAALTLACAELPVDSSVSLEAVARDCNGYAAADLVLLVREATLNAARRGRGAAPTMSIATSETRLAAGADTLASPSPHPVLDRLSLRSEDFDAAVRSVRASTLRPTSSAMAPVEPLDWSKIGGAEEVKLRVRRAVEWPIQRASAYRRLGIGAPRGVLLHGPPGCAKTSLARAAAGASGVSFVYLSGATLYSPYVGEAERQLRDFFSLGRACAPSILFLDELDAIVGSRAEIASGGEGGGGGGGVQLRVLSTLLNEMDGLGGASGIVVIGATNRRDALDAALLRPGRFDELIEVGVPDTAGREAILRVHTDTMPIAADVDMCDLAAQCAGWSGAQIAALCREAAMCALRERMDTPSHVTMHHFGAALSRVHAS